MGFGRSVLVATWLAALVACHQPGVALHDTRARSAATAAPARGGESASDAGLDGGHACLGSPLRAYDESPGVLQRVYVELPVDGRTMPFFLDTGSAQSFRRLDTSVGPVPGPSPGPGPELVARESPTTISCMNVGLAFSRASVFAATPDGRALGGVLGTDLLAVGGVLDLRIRESLFVWSGAVPPLPPGMVTLPATFTTSTDPYGASKLVVDDVALDGKKVRLLVDTGSPHVVVIDKTPRLDETVIDSIDGTGARVRFYESTVDIAFGGGPPHRVTVDRAASFPTLEKVLAAIGGGEVAGILGIGALGHERIVIAKDALRFVP